jgi:hypothetical protein
MSTRTFAASPGVRPSPQGRAALQRLRAAAVVFATGMAALLGTAPGTAAAGTAPVIGANPASLSAALAPGASTTQALTISNLGGGSLDWSVLDQSTVVRDFRRDAALRLNPSEYYLASAVIDPAGRYAYLGTSTPPGQVVKIDLKTWQRVDAITLANDEGEGTESFLFSAVMDPAGRYAYFGTGNYPGKVVKIDLERFKRVDSLTLEFGEDVLRSAVIDANGAFAYFGTDTYPGHIVKVDLTSFTRVASIDLDESIPYVNPAAVIDPSGRYAYFGAYFGNLLKIDLANFTLAGNLDTGVATLLGAALIEPSGRFAYFGTYGDPGQIVKVDLANFSLSGTLTLPAGEARPTVGVLSNDGASAYFGTRQTSPGHVVKIDLASFTRVGGVTLNQGEDDLRGAIIDPASGNLYFAAATFPGQLIKLVDNAYDCALPAWVSAVPGSGSVAAGANQVVNVGFNAAGLPIGRHDAALCLQSNDPVTQRIAVPLTAEVRVAEVSPSHLAFDVVRGGNGSNTVSIANRSSSDLTWNIAQADPAQGCGTPATAPWLSTSPAGGNVSPGNSTTVGVSVDTAALAAGRYASLLCISASSGSDTQTSTVALDLSVSEPTPVFSVDPGSLSLSLPAGQSGNADLALRNGGAGALDWNLLSTSVAPHLDDSFVADGQAVFTASVVDPAGRYAYFGTNSIPGSIVKVDLATFKRVATIALPSGEDAPRSAVIDAAGRYAYFGTYTQPGNVIKIDLQSFQRVGAITLQAGEDQLSSAVIDATGTYAYFGTSTEVGQVVKIDLASFTRVAAIDFSAGTEEGYLIAATIDLSGHYAYFGTGPLTGKAVRVDLTTFERVDSITIADDQGTSAALMDPSGRFVYFGTNPPFIGAARLVKVDLASFQVTETVELDINNYEGGITAAVIDPHGNYALLGNTWGSATRLVEVDLQGFYRVGAISLGVTEGGFHSAVIDPAGRYAYFGTPLYPGTTAPGRLLRVEGRLECVLPAWLSVAQSSGSVPAGGSQTLQVGASANGLAPGAHAANLCFASNDPAAPLQVAPVTLTVAVGDRIFANGFDPSAR